MIRGADYVNKLKEYITLDLKKGYTQESLKQALINQGHSKFSVDRAITLAEYEFAEEAPILKTKPVITREIIETKIEEKKSFWKRLFG
ncbi:hypothetical protein AUJ84_03045 [Candidatus Pacearchaeota archaeon CG1_02_32_132]|nr:MAG: hypothetical protein AUJ84_03045 [Candidatus Pacearchaeota archaeon CG1_02_32_132]